MALKQKLTPYQNKRELIYLNKNYYPELLERKQRFSYSYDYIPNPNSSQEFFNNDEYQHNIQVSNNTIKNIIEANKPDYVQNTEFLKPVEFQRDPADKYVSFRI